jgi:hypothetical protein
MTYPPRATRPSRRFALGWKAAGWRQKNLDSTFSLLPHPTLPAILWLDLTSSIHSHRHRAIRKVQTGALLG